MAAAKFSNQIDWDGRSLSFEAETDRGYISCRILRDTIHVIHLYNDAIGREIYIDRHRIVEKLAPFLQAKLSVPTSVNSIELLPCDVED
jgi:hypothetical protein